MRFRRKKHLDERLEACADIILYDMEEFHQDMKSVFENDNPICMEIGCGKGRFILETAAGNPDKNYIAVEKNLNALLLAAEKIKGAGLTNVKFIAGDVNILREFETKTKCEIIYINFCDPSVGRIAGLAGYDFIWIDMEHNYISFESLLALVIAVKSAGTDVIVRAPQDDLTATKKIIEMGVDGIIFPMVKTAEEAML